MSTEDELLAKLREALAVAVRESMRQVRADHPMEQQYAYVLYVSPLFEYVSPSFNTEEALKRVSSREYSAEDLRWSPPDWQYHLETGEAFEGIDELVEQHIELTGWDNEQAIERREAALVDTLRELDREGIFGTGEERDKITVNIMWGDQNIFEHVRSAKQLNPPPAYLAYAQHELPWLYHQREEFAQISEGEKFAAETIEMVERDLKQAGR